MSRDMLEKRVTSSCKYGLIAWKNIEIIMLPAIVLFN